ANSLELIGDVANPASGIDVGFVAQDVSANKDGPVLAIGQIQVQPLFIFANAELGRRSTIDDLRGRKIVLPPQSSATADAAIRMLKLYDISPDNTSFTFAKLVDALRDLHGGKYDAGAFMLAPENDVVRDLINDSGLHLLPVPEARAVVNH